MFVAYYLLRPNCFNPNNIVRHSFIMSTKRTPGTVRGWIAYVATLSVMIFGTMYLFMRVFRWSLFLSAPLSSLLSAVAAYLACRCAEASLRDSATTDNDRLSR